MKKYGVLVVDPPWSYGATKNQRDLSRSVAKQYKVIGKGDKEINRRTGAGIQESIEFVPVLEWAKDNAHLYMWVTNPKLPFAFEVMNVWGFTYKTMLTWVKSTGAGGIHGGGMGWFFRGATEHVLFGVRGNMPIPSSLRRPNAFLAPPTGHSVKPDAFYSLVETVSLDLDRIDVFARKQRAGWDVYGDEVENSPGCFDSTIIENEAS